MSDININESKFIFLYHDKCAILRILNISLEVHVQQRTYTYIFWITNFAIIRTLLTVHNIVINLSRKQIQ